MATSISGGVHLGDNDGSPYLSLTAQIGTLPVINLEIGPASSLSLTGGITEPILAPALGDALAGNVLDAVLPPILGGVLAEQVPVIAGSNVLLGGTQINLPIGIANPILFS